MARSRLFSCAVTALTAASLSACVVEREPEVVVVERQDDVAIAFADIGGVEDWRAYSNDEIFIEGRNNRIYRGTFMGPCLGLQFENSIGFVTEPAGDLGRYGGVIVDGRTCYFRTFAELRGINDLDDIAGL